MHEVLVNRLGGLSLPRKSVVRLFDRPDMTLDVYHECKTTTQHIDSSFRLIVVLMCRLFLTFGIVTNFANCMQTVMNCQLEKMH